MKLLLPVIVIAVQIVVAPLTASAAEDNENISENKWSRQSVTNAALLSKTNQNLTWTQLGARLNCSPTWLASVVLGQSSIQSDRAALLGDILQLPPAASFQLSQPPLKAQADFRTLFQDPLLYRLHEIALVYGTSIKQMIHELFGDGIMSAIDFTVDVERDGERVRIVMSGKFLAYRRW